MAGSIHTGADGFKAVVSDPADEKCPGIPPSEPSTLKRPVECGGT